MFIVENADMEKLGRATILPPRADCCEHLGISVVSYFCLMCDHAVLKQVCSFSINPAGMFPHILKNIIAVSVGYKCHLDVFNYFPVTGNPVSPPALFFISNSTVVKSPVYIAFVHIHMHYYFLGYEMSLPEEGASFGLFISIAKLLQ